MKILVVDNGGQWTHREWRVLKYLKVETEIIPNTTPIEDIKADGIVLSGGAPRIGSDSNPLGNTSDYIEKLDIPILGICAGHQFIAMHFGAEVGPANLPEYGKAEIELDERNNILKGFPSKFIAWMSHNDEIKKLPENFIVLAHSKDCPVQAFRHKSRPLYGVQFHPEVEHTEHGYKIFENFIRICQDRS